MRFDQITMIDEIKDGDLFKAPTKNFTIGFEFEISMGDKKTSFDDWIGFQDIEEFLDREEWFSNNIVYFYENVFEELAAPLIVKKDGDIYLKDSRGKGHLIRKMDEDTFVSILDREAEGYVSEKLDELYQEEATERAREWFEGMEEEEYVDSDRQKEEVAELLSGVVDGMVDVDHWDEDQWAVVDDQTISPSGVELVSPVFNYNQAIRNLEIVMTMINESPDMVTNDSTGLHVNIGTINDINQIDLLKLLVFSGESRVLDVFDRSNNTYTEENLTKLINDLRRMDKEGGAPNYQAEFNKVIASLNEIVLKTANKYRFINLAKLPKLGYIEFRGMGGDYASKGKEIVQNINRFCNLVEIAMNPQMYRNEYLKKIYKFIDKKDSNASGSIDNKFIKKMNQLNAMLKKNHSIELSKGKNHTTSFPLLLWGIASGLTDEENNNRPLTAEEKMTIRELEQVMKKNTHSDKDMKSLEKMIDRIKTPDGKFLKSLLNKK